MDSEERIEQQEQQSQEQEQKQEQPLEERRCTLQATCVFSSLKQAVSLLQKAAPKTSLPQLGAIWIESVPDVHELCLSVTDLETCLSLRLTARIDSSGAFGISAATLNKMLRTVKVSAEELIDIRVSKDGEHTVCELFIGDDIELRPEGAMTWDGDVPALLSSFEDIALPPPTDEQYIQIGNVQSITMPLSLLNDCLQRTMEQADDPETARESLAGVFLQLRDGMLSFAAGNGFVLAAIDLNLAEHSEIDVSQVQGPVDRIIPINAVRHWLNITRKSTSTTTTLQWRTHTGMKQNLGWRENTETGQDEKVFDGTWQAVWETAYFRFTTEGDETVLMVKEKDGVRIPNYNRSMAPYNGPFLLRVTTKVEPLLNALKLVKENATPIGGIHFLRLWATPGDLYVQTTEPWSHAPEVKATVSIRLDCIFNSREVQAQMLALNGKYLIPMLEKMKKQAQYVTLAIADDWEMNEDEVPDGWSEEEWRTHCTDQRKKMAASAEKRPMEIRIAGNPEWRACISPVTRR